VGVPDVRIIVYRGVPVMGMVRLPTKDSDGKANLHQGAIGAGIEMGNGKTLTAVHRSKVITHHPDTGNPVSGIQVPHWEKMLLMAARAFEMTGLGYLGIDMASWRSWRTAPACAGAWKGWRGLPGRSWINPKHGCHGRWRLLGRKKSEQTAYLILIPGGYAKIALASLEEERKKTFFVGGA